MVDHSFQDVYHGWTSSAGMSSTPFEFHLLSALTVDS